MQKEMIEKELTQKKRIDIEVFKQFLSIWLLSIFLLSRPFWKCQGQRKERETTVPYHFCRKRRGHLQGMCNSGKEETAVKAAALVKTKWNKVGKRRSLLCMHVGFKLNFIKRQNLLTWQKIFHSLWEKLFFIFFGKRNIGKKTRTAHSIIDAVSR